MKYVMVWKNHFKKQKKEFECKLNYQPINYKYLDNLWTVNIYMSSDSIIARHTLASSIHRNRYVDSQQR